MTKDLKIVNPITVTDSVRYRGILNSDSENDFREMAANDIQDLGKAINTLYSMILRSNSINHNESAYLRRQIGSLIQQREWEDSAKASLGFTSHRYIDLRDTKGVLFPNNDTDQFSAMVNAQFGEATLPANAIHNRFFSTSISTGRVVVPADLVTKVTSIFDKGDGEGLVDYERGGRVTVGKPENAFNGNNQSFWVRRVEFPLDSRVDQVEVELTVDVPEGGSSKANVIEIYPYGNGSMDLQSVSTSADSSDTFTSLAGFTATNNITFKRYHFPVQRVERIKVRLRQRNWITENGKKVFYYGLQELGLRLVDYDKGYTSGATFGKNHTFVVQLDAPTDRGFLNLHRVVPEPNFLKEDAGNRHVRLRIGTDSTFTTWLWDSDSNQAPQDSGTAIALGSAGTLYLGYELRFVATSGGSISPYSVGTTPFINGTGLTYDLAEI